MANGLELIWPTEWAKEKVLSVQEYTLLAAQSIANIFRKPLYVADMVQQADLIGGGSLPIVVLTGFFTGGVLALQTSNTLERFGSITLIGQLVSTSMVRERGPVLTGLMVAGRNTSGMASELGSMVVTEQIDAMRALGADPMKKLGDAARERNRVHGVLSHHHLGSSRHIWRLVHRQADSHPGCDAVFAQCLAVTGVSRRIHGTDQAVMFGFIIATIGSYYGMTSRGGTQGVGRATTQAVVAASVVILLMDLLITKVLMAVLSYR